MCPGCSLSSRQRSSARERSMGSNEIQRYGFAYNKQSEDVTGMRKGNARARRTVHRPGQGSRLQLALSTRRHRFAVAWEIATSRGLRRTTQRTDTALGTEPTPPILQIRPHYAQGRVTTRRWSWHDQARSFPLWQLLASASRVLNHARSLSPILWALTTTLPPHQHAPACFPRSTPPSTRMRATLSGDQSGNLDFDTPRLERGLLAEQE